MARIGVGMTFSSFSRLRLWLLLVLVSLVIGAGVVRMAAAQATRRTDYTLFPHREAAHRKDCSVCHKFPSANWKEVRKADEAFPDQTDFPQHQACIGCHQTQFFQGKKPEICSNCHVNPSPKDSTRFPFPSLGEKFDESEKGRREFPQFTVGFPHEKHKDFFDKCDACHQVYKPQGDSKEEFVTPPPKDLADGAFWLRKGTFMAAPRTHAQCFTCHTPEGTPASSQCAVCHKLRPDGGRTPGNAPDDFDSKTVSRMGITDKYALLKWSRREVSKFQHDHPVHSTIACTDCHDISKLNTAD
ncbi:MAG TPA: cytochrome c3 family protein, partial [Blastocatellia bacterium]|nr:cytochrome c3 family protein [Blastocatellia bacterium]